MKQVIQTMAELSAIQFDSHGLVPVITQDAVTGNVLMLAWANQASLEQTLETGRMTYWSRSRKTLWEKGATSGHTQSVVSLALDCDRDAILARVQQIGPACHEGSASCWSEQPQSDWMSHLQALAAARQTAPSGGYTDELLANPTLVAAKLEEEAAEVATVVRGEPNDDSLAHEAADLVYHLVVALQAKGVAWHDVLRELAARSKPSESSY